MNFRRMAIANPRLLAYLFLFCCVVFVVLLLLFNKHCVVDIVLCVTVCMQEDYYVAHQCFLTNRALYLLVWNVMDGEAGMESLTIWLQNLHVCIPESAMFEKCHVCFNHVRKRQYIFVRGGNIALGGHALHDPHTINNGFLIIHWFKYNCRVYLITANICRANTCL